MKISHYHHSIHSYYIITLTISTYRMKMNTPSHNPHHYIVNAQPDDLWKHCLNIHLLSVYSLCLQLYIARCVWGEMILGRQAVTRFATHEPSLRSEIWPFPSSSYSPPFPPLAPSSSFHPSLPLLIFLLLILLFAPELLSATHTNSRILTFPFTKQTHQHVVVRWAEYICTHSFCRNSTYFIVFDLLLIAESVANLERPVITQLGHSSHIAILYF